MTRGFAVVLTLVVMGFAVFAGWSSTRTADYFPDDLRTTQAECSGISGERYRWAIMSEFEDGWYSGVLADFEEPPLHSRPSDGLRTVRFLWLRSFHDPIVVRVENLPDGRLSLIAKQQVRRAIFGREKASDRGVRRILSPSEQGAFESALQVSRLFEQASSGCAGGADGSQWIVEGTDPEHGYRYWQRWSPQDVGERAFGLFLLGLTGWDVEPIY